MRVGDRHAGGRYGRAPPDARVEAGEAGRDGEHFFLFS
jgi:hypothetical protein